MHLVSSGFLLSPCLVCLELHFQYRVCLTIAQEFWDDSAALGSWRAIETDTSGQQQCHSQKLQEPIGEVWYGRF